MPPSDTAPPLRAWLRQGPFALGLSSGFFGFFAHAGALSALEEEGLLPDHVSGSSAGALVAALWAAGLDAAAIAEALFRVQRAHFWDPALGLGLLRGERMRALLEETLPVPSFERCRARLSISVFDVLAWRTRALDAGPLCDVVRASCAVPFMFHPVWIGGRPYLDGGLFDRPGLAGLAAAPRVLLHLLPSRSRPWLRARPPVRAGLATVTARRLPAAGPFRLERGPAAFEAARRAMKEALSSPAPT